MGRDATLADQIDLARQRFEALSPEEQHAHREAQRRSWVRGETALDRDETATQPSAAQPAPEASAAEMTLATAEGSDVASLIAFARWALCASSFLGADLCGGAVQDKALALGLLKEERFDPARHASVAMEDFEPGDRIFVFAGPLATKPKNGGVS